MSGQGWLSFNQIYLVNNINTRLSVRLELLSAIIDLAGNY